MKSRNGQPTHAGVGAASVIMIFVVLCLTALSVLSLTSARTAAKASSRRSEAVCAYYRAASDAQLFLAETNDMALKGEISTGDKRKKVIPFGESQKLTVIVEVADDGARIIGHTVGADDYMLYGDTSLKLPSDVQTDGEDKNILFVD